MKNFEEELMDAEEYRKYLVYALNSLDKRIKCNAKDAYYDDMADFSYKRAIIAKELFELDKKLEQTYIINELMGETNETENNW